MRLRTKRAASGAAPLSAHLVLSTEKLSEGQELTSRIWSRHKSEVPGKRRYSAKISRLPLGRSWLCYVDCRSAMHVEAEGCKTKAFVYAPVRGSMRISVRGERFHVPAGGVALVPAATPLAYDATPIKCIVLEVPAQKLRAEFATCGLADPGGRSHAWPPATAAARSVTALLGFALDELGGEGRDEDFPHYHRRLEALIIAGLGKAVAGQADAGAPGTPRIGRVSVEAMKRWIHGSAEACPGAAEMAAYAGIKPRALQKLFLKHFNTTPANYVRDVRLGAARKQFLDPRCAKSVTAVATGMGFDHLGRFAVAYHQKFGETPSATLQGRSGTARRLSEKRTRNNAPHG